MESRLVYCSLTNKINPKAIIMQIKEEKSNLAVLKRGQSWRLSWKKSQELEKEHLALPAVTSAMLRMPLNTEGLQLGQSQGRWFKGWSWLQRRRQTRNTWVTAPRWYWGTWNGQGFKSHCCEKNLWFGSCSCKIKLFLKISSKVCIKVSLHDLPFLSKPPNTKRSLNPAETPFLCINSLDNDFFSWGHNIAPYGAAHGGFWDLGTCEACGKAWNETSADAQQFVFLGEYFFPGRGRQLQLNQGLWAERAKVPGCRGKYRQEAEAGKGRIHFLGYAQAWWCTTTSAAIKIKGVRFASPLVSARGLLFCLLHSF